MQEEEVLTKHDSGWTPVLVAIAVTGLLVGLIGGVLSSQYVNRVKKERSDAFQKRQETGASIFAELLNKVDKETVEETTE